MADGANAEFGRSSGGFVNVVTKSGTNDLARHGPRLLQGRRAGVGAPRTPDGSAADKFDFDQQQFGFTLGGPLKKDKLFYFVGRRLPERQLDEADRPDPHRAARRRLLREPRQPGRERARSSGPTTRGSSWPSSTGTSSPTAPRDPALQLHLGRAEERDVRRRLLGHAAPTRSRTDYSNAVTGSLDLDPLPHAPQRVPLPVRPGGPAAPLRRAEHHGPEPAAPRHRLRLRRAATASAMPFFIPVDYYDTRIQFNDNVSVIKGRHSIKVGRRVQPRATPTQTFLGFANGRYIFGSTDGFLNYARNPSYVECSDGSTSETGTCPAGASDHRAGAPLPPAGGRRRPDGRGGRHADDPPERAGGLRPGQVAAQPEPDDPVRPALGGADPARPDHARRTRSSTPASSARPSPTAGTFRFPSDGTIPSDYEMWQPRARDLLGPDEATGRRSSAAERAGSSTPASRA